MSSILTNNGAMVALQTLRGINSNLADTQNAIATGKDVSNAKDNSAVWAISKVMESDVAGFKAISDNLGLGASTVAVARQAAETTTDLLKEMKGKVVASQEENVDRDKIQEDIVALRDQIASVTNAAQFNGLNLLSNQDFRTSGTGSVDILSSLDRSSSGVTASDINVSKQDLSQDAVNWTTATGSTSTATFTQSTTLAAGASKGAVYTAAAAPAVGTLFQVGVYNAGTDSTTFGGQTVSGDVSVQFGVREGDTQTDLAQQLTTALNFVADSVDLDVSFSVSSQTAGAIDLTNDGTAALAASATYTITSNATSTTTGTRAVGGGLSMLQKFDVTTADGAEAALGAIEDLIQTSIDSAAAFGSSQGRIETQQDFVSGLMDSLKSGIGTLVDADMEEESARLQALQVQQQLGVQALSIANQAPQQLLSLFR